MKPTDDGRAGLYPITRRDAMRAAGLTTGALVFGGTGLTAFAGSAAAATGTMTVRSGTSTQVVGYRAGDDAGAFPTSTPNVDADLSWVHPAWSGTTHTFDAETRWIWHSDETSTTNQTVGGHPTYYVREPVAGDVVEFEETFSIPGAPTSGTLHITADNGYEVSVNGTPVGSATVHDVGGVDWEDSDLSQPYVTAAPGTWNIVESYDVSSLLVYGPNVLTVLGGNEQMSPADGESTGSVTSNPGGVIYELDIEYEDSLEWPLCAGQDIPVGTVSVTETADGLDVTYETTGGWTLVETHLHVADDPGDFPLTKQGNPKVGQFAYSESHDGATSHTYHVDHDGLCAYVAAHAVVEMTLESAPFGAASVVSSAQGPRKDGGAVRAARSDPANALAFETGQNESNFFSLGFGGSIVVEFAHPVMDGPGADLRLVEDTWGPGYPLEQAAVSVSQDGVSWTPLGTADNTQQSGIHTISEFDLAGSGLDWFRFVEVVDTTDPAPHNGAADGYDLNAVLALHDAVQEETAWLCADGTGVSRFTEQGSWATYVDLCP